MAKYKSAYLSTCSIVPFSTGDQIRSLTIKLHCIFFYMAFIIKLQWTVIVWYFLLRQRFLLLHSSTVFTYLFLHTPYFVVSPVESYLVSYLVVVCFRKKLHIRLHLLRCQSLLFAPWPAWTSFKYAFPVSWKNFPNIGLV